MENFLFDNLLHFSLKNRYLKAVEKIYLQMKKLQHDISDWLHLCVCMIYIKNDISMENFLDLIKITNDIYISSNEFAELKDYVDHFKRYSKRLALSYFLEHDMENDDNLISCISLLNHYFNPHSTKSYDLQFRSGYVEVLQDNESRENWIRNGWPKRKQFMFTKLQKIIDQIISCLSDTIFCREQLNQSKTLNILRFIDIPLSKIILSSVQGKCWLFEDDVLDIIDEYDRLSPTGDSDD